jgi:hypothetical protein
MIDFMILCKNRDQWNAEPNKRLLRGCYGGNILDIMLDLDKGKLIFCCM